MRENFDSQSQAVNISENKAASIFHQYFNNKFQEEEKQQDLERMSIQPTNQEESIQVGDDQFRFKKFNS